MISSMVFWASAFTSSGDGVSLIVSVLSVWILSSILSFTEKQSSLVPWWRSRPAIPKQSSLRLSP